MRPHRRQPIRLPCPWDSPGKNTGVGCHFLLQCMEVKRESEVAQSCLTLSNPMDCSLAGSSVQGIFQAKVPEWGAIAFSGYTGDSGSVLGLGRSLEEDLATHSSILTHSLSPACSQGPQHSRRSGDSGFAQACLAVSPLTRHTT